MSQGTGERIAGPDVVPDATAVPQSPDLIAFDGPVFAAYDESLFVSHDAWRELERVVVSNRGGNYALTGPRGSGKSWVISRAVDLANASKGLGVQFSSPSDYDPLSFLTSLARHLANTYIDQYLDRHQIITERRRRIQRRTPMLILALGTLVGYVLVFIGIFHTKLHVNAYFVAAGVSFVIAMILYVLVTQGLRRSASNDDEFYERAVELRRNAIYVTALKDSAEQSASGGAKGVALGFKRARETALTERTPTVGSLSQSIRDFLTRLARSETTGSIDDTFGPIVIGIDELDKMDSADSIAQLLRDIKGVFDIRGVHFLVSISDEAARNLDLAGVQRRNEFNSSFYQVFTVRLSDIAEYRELFDRRGIHPPEALLVPLVVLSGGVARELVRLSALAVENRVSLKDHAFEALIIDLEMDALQAEIESADGGSEPERLTEGDLLRVHRIASIEFRENPTLLGSFDFLEDRLWTPADASQAWNARFAMSWRRLLVRGAIARFLVNESMPVPNGTLVRLQDIARRNINSPVVARALLEGMRHQG